MSKGYEVTSELPGQPTSMNDFLHSNCTSPEQECILRQLDVEVNDEEETIATTQQAADCEEFARPTKKW